MSHFSLPLRPSTTMSGLTFARISSSHSHTAQYRSAALSTSRFAAASASVSSRAAAAAALCSAPSSAAAVCRVGCTLSSCEPTISQSVHTSQRPALEGGFRVDWRSGSSRQPGQSNRASPAPPGVTPGAEHSHTRCGDGTFAATQWQGRQHMSSDGLAGNAYQLALLTRSGPSLPA